MLAGLFPILVMAAPYASATTRFVGGGGPGNYTTIQDAVNAAIPGDRVYVFNGIYRENVVVTKSIALVGQSRESTIIDARRITRGIQLGAAGIQVSGFTITSGYPGIDINSVANSVISLNIISNGVDGISVTNVLQASIADNIISSNSGDGIRLTSSGGITIADNVIASNGNYGIELISSVGNVIRGNVASSNRRGISLDSSSSNRIQGNTAQSNSENQYPYIGVGIYLRSSSTNTISGNNVSSNNRAGLRLENSANNLITANTAASSQTGIDLILSSENAMTNNRVSLNYEGISLTSSTTNAIAGNSIASNGGTGLAVDSSGNNTIWGNSVSSNYGYGFQLALSDGNRIFHNNVVGNGRQAFDNGANEWDDGYPSGGNYWSDYAGGDLFSGPSQNQPGSDGIGDALYYVPVGSSVDQYPMIGPNSVPDSPPSQPQNFRVQSGNGRATLTWEAPSSDGGSPVLNYRIYRRERYYQEEFLLQIGNVLTYTDTGLTNGVPYTYRVSAANAIGEGLKADEATAIPATVPGAPRGLAAIASSRVVTLTWLIPLDNGGSQVTNFRVYRGVTPGGESLLAEIGNVTQFIDLGLTNGVTYYYQLTAKNGVGEGPRAPEVLATPAAVVTVPTVPSRLSASAGDRSIMLTWAPPADNGGSPVTNYLVYRGLFTGGEAFLQEVGDVLTYADTGLTNGVTYFYRVSARNAIGEGPKSDSIGATPVTLPGAPVGLSAAAGNRRVVLTWLAPVDAGGSAVTHYSVYRGTVPGGEVYLTTPGNVLTYTDLAVENEVVYYYQVTASNAVGEGPRSFEVGATPESPPPNQVPTCAVTTPESDRLIGGRYAVLGTASDPDGAIEFVEVRVDGSGWSHAVGTNSWSYDLDTTIFSNGEHTIYARSFDGTDYSNLAAVSITISNAVERPPPGISVFEQPWFWVLVTAIVVAAVFLAASHLRRGPRTKPKDETSGKTPPKTDGTGRT